MKALAPVIHLTLIILTASAGHGGEEGGRACHRTGVPEATCEIHERPLEVTAVPIVYGLPAPDFLTVGSVEHTCRYRLEGEARFPDAAPESVSGGCFVLDDETEDVCACPECTAAERAWSERYPQRSDVTPWRPYTPPADPERVETELHLRIQELRAFAHTELADCLQAEWERSFGHD